MYPGEHDGAMLQSTSATILRCASSCFRFTCVPALAALLLVACGPRQAPIREAPATFAEPAEAALVERGRYLAEHVAACVACHTDRNRWDHAQETGPRWAGGLHFHEEMDGVPGQVVSTNLTAHVEDGLGAWSDAEIVRAVREGWSRDGRALVPIMPYRNYRFMSDRDVTALVAWLRTLPPRPVHRPGETRLRFPWRLAVRWLPEPVATPVPGPSPTAPPAERGTYLATLMGCADCHTATRRGQPRPGREQAGGVVLTLAGGSSIVSPNITPDPETGLGDYPLEAWLRLAREGVKRDGGPIVVNMMPWTAWRGMSDADLAAVWACATCRRSGST